MENSSEKDSKASNRFSAMSNREQFLHPILSARTFWRFLSHLAAEFIDKKCQRSAAALTYMTLFALVPMMTVTYAMFSIIPAFDGVADQLQDLIFTHIIPSSGSELKRHLSNFSSQARNLTWPGIAMLGVTAYLMLTNIEKTFNNIWGVDQARRGLSSFLLYWAVLSIGPILLGVGLLMSTYILSQKLMVGEVNVMTAVAPLFRILPVAFSTISFTLLFAAVPNCRVPLKYAVVGGLVTALCFELLKLVFGALVAKSSFQLIYGAFAAVPLFLLWINFLWMIILGGAVFVRTLAEKDYAIRRRKLSNMMAIIVCLEMFREKSKSGELVTDEDCVRLGLGLVHWQMLRSLLVKNKWIAVTDNGNYTLCRDLNLVTLWDIANVVKMPVGELLEAHGSSAVLKNVEQAYGEVHEFAKDRLSVSLEALFGTKSP